MNEIENIDMINSENDITIYKQDINKPILMDGLIFKDIGNKAMFRVFKELRKQINEYTKNYNLKI